MILKFDNEKYLRLFKTMYLKKKFENLDFFLICFKNFLIILLKQYLKIK